MEVSVVKGRRQKTAPSNPRPHYMTPEQFDEAKQRSSLLVKQGFRCAACGGIGGTFVLLPKLAKVVCAACWPVLRREEESA